MPKKKPAKPKPPPHIAVPFPASPLLPDETVAKYEELPELQPVEHAEFKVQCQVTSVGAKFWSGVMFVALEATDGQKLQDLLREGQKVVIHYSKD
jgi:hypothetical protein